LNGYQEFYDFMEEYTCFFQDAADLEEEKLAALLSDDLHRIERALMEHQRVTKQIEQYELRRAQLQERLGIGGKTFREIIDLTDGAERQDLKFLFSAFEAAIQCIKHANARSLDIARLNLRILDEISPVGITDPQLYDQHGVSADTMGKSVNLLHKQV